MAESMSSDERDQLELSIVGWGNVPAPGGSRMLVTLSWPLLVLSFGDFGAWLRVRPRFVSFFAINSTKVTVPTAGSGTHVVLVGYRELN